MLCTILAFRKGVYPHGAKIQKICAKFKKSYLTLLFVVTSSCFVIPRVFLCHPFRSTPSIQVTGHYTHSYFNEKNVSTFKNAYNSNCFTSTVDVGKLSNLPTAASAFTGTTMTIVARSWCRLA